MSRKSSLEILLRDKIDKGRKILSAYVMLGYPTLDKSIKLIEQIDQYVDIIEIGIPFSDPIADGEIIQHASKIALANGITIDKAWEVIKKLNIKEDVGLVLMTYANILLNVEIPVDIVDSFIIPDLPIDEEFSHHMPYTSIISPNSSEKRISMNVKNTNGFVYLVSNLSTTGGQFIVDKRNINIINKIRLIDRMKPILIGFGISNTSDIESVLNTGADGIIIGSEIISKLDKNENAVDYIKNIRTFLDLYSSHL
ncbi:MAG: tryptophan synthase subunit alpha [Candidatus Heimdallarchaeota archaeon]|nr:tryptophan synthase subunit alpha [Candidatus Heimdallarchaeota archaeon]